MDLSELVLELQNGAFSVTYAKSSLICKLELSTAILDFDPFEVTENAIFHN